LSFVAYIYCRKSRIVLEKNYPLEIDFTRLPERVNALIPELMSIISVEVNNSFRDDALGAVKIANYINTKVPKFSSKTFLFIVLFNVLIY
jgi:hypothetical protein